jgi:hypothetical protein
MVSGTDGRTVRDDSAADDAAARLERTATSLFGSTSIVAALVIGAMLISAWHAGSLDNRIEWLFWAGAILGAAGIGCLGFACLPRVGAVDAATRQSMRARAGLIRVGLILFMAAPVLCTIAVFTDYWI